MSKRFGRSKRRRLRELEKMNLVIVSRHEDFNNSDNCREQRLNVEIVVPSSNEGYRPIVSSENDKCRDVLYAYFKEATNDSE